MTDERLMEMACLSIGCTYYAEEGYIYCGVCMRGLSEPLSKELAERKLAIEKVSQKG